MRGITTAEQAQHFLNPTLADLHSPSLMKNLDAAVARLRKAIETGETVFIYGDYDVDGTTAIVILKTALELCGGKVDYHVPHRIREGYDMRGEVIEQAADRGIRLIISVDTGIRAFAAAETAARRGIDLIVTDHHLPPPEGLPRALAVVNPNQPGCEYPCKSLCGAGIAFKIAQALLVESGRERLIPSFLKMVAIATIADAVPLTGENRVFAKLGLQELRRPVNPGLRALLANCQLDGRRPLSAGDIGFRVAPRLNAAGRMDVAAARHRAVQREGRDQGRGAGAATQPAQWRPPTGRAAHPRRDREDDRELTGVEGRVLPGGGRRGLASRRDRHLRHAGGGAALPADADLLARRRAGAWLGALHQGVSSAAGDGVVSRAVHALRRTLACRRVFVAGGERRELRARLDAYARARLTPEDFIPLMEYDAEVSLSEITENFFRELQRLEPFGVGNPTPVFVARRARLLQPPRVLKEKHMKLRVLPEEPGRFQRAHDVLCWRMAERLGQANLVVGESLDLAFTLDYNAHPEFGGVQLSMVDFQRSAQAQAVGSG